MAPTSHEIAAWIVASGIVLCSIEWRVVQLTGWCGPQSSFNTVTASHIPRPSNYGLLLDNIPLHRQPCVSSMFARSSTSVSAPTTSERGMPRVKCSVQNGYKKRLGISRGVLLAQVHGRRKLFWERGSAGAWARGRVGAVGLVGEVLEWG